MDHYDIFIIGGGINGAGVARDAVGRGLSVGLCEKDDLAAHTSSASTKLIHGGLRYLEHYEFGLVRKALTEREVLLRAAPHIIWPLRFVLPHHKGLRPKWLLRLGLFLYDHLGGRHILPGTRRVELTRPPFRGQLKDLYRTGFEYSDCWVDDARLVALNAMDAAENGAKIYTYCTCIGLERRSDHWLIDLKPADGPVFRVKASTIVNATGPWVDKTEELIMQAHEAPQTRLVKGSHIITRTLFDGDYAYIFQNTDGRIVFAIPYEERFTLIGTTDVAVDRPEDGAQITDHEIAYLCDLINGYLSTEIGPGDVLSSYAGVRPLYDDTEDEASKVTRDYKLVLYHDDGGPPALSVYGGKITTYRVLAEDALTRLTPYLSPVAEDWTENAPLPGGDIADANFDGFLDDVRKHYPWLEHGLSKRLARTYGTRIFSVLGDATAIEHLGRHFGAHLYERETEYLCRHEFAKQPDDILWRRTKCGLHMTADERKAFADWFAGKRV